MVGEHLIAPIVTAAASGLFAWLLYRGLRSGKMRWPFLWWAAAGRRADQPARFWLIAAGLGAMAAIATAATLFLLFCPRA